MKKLALAAALLATMSAANAYQTEVGATYENTDYDDLGDLDLFSINGKYYLNPVNNSSAPLAEAAFLNRASNIGLGYANASGDGPDDIDVLGVSGEYYIPDTQFYVSAGVNRTDAGGDKNTGYSAEVGFLPMTGWIAAIGIAKENFDPIQAGKFGFNTALGSALAAGDDSAVTLRTKYVGNLNTSNTFNLEAQAIVGDETGYRFAGDIYLDPTLSVGASYADATGEDTNNVFGVHAQKFLTPTAAVGLGYTTSDNADSFGINGTFRF